MGFLEDLAARRRFGMKPGLGTIRAVCAALGGPERRLRGVVHVAGTNGKGAVCALLDACLRAAGRKVARYTSPHLVRLNERFFLDGAPLADAVLETASARVAEAARGCADLTFFEALTAVGFAAFADADPDSTVLETGLGGRLDATNICRPALAVITRIGLDHCDWLGTTHAAIAEEKAGIVKKGRPVVVGAMPAVAREEIALAAERAGAPFISAECCSVAASPGGDWTHPVFATPRRRLPPVAMSLPMRLSGGLSPRSLPASAATKTSTKPCGSSRRWSGRALPCGRTTRGRSTRRSWRGKWSLPEFRRFRAIPYI